MSKSEQNLADAFAGESQANRKYLAFAQQAEKEGYKQAAKLFRAAAEAETVHAHAHLRTMNGVGKTVDNLKTAIAGETHEFKKMYPAFIEVAKQEAQKAAERSFTYANAVEKIHAGPVPEGSGHPRQERGRGLLCLFCLRNDRRERSPGQVSSVRCRKKGFFQSGLVWRPGSSFNMCARPPLKGGDEWPKGLFLWTMSMKCMSPTSKAVKLSSPLRRPMQGHPSFGTKLKPFATTVPGMGSSGK